MLTALIKKNYWPRLLILSAAIFLSLWLAESFVRVFYPQQLIRNLKIWKPEPLIGWRHMESLNTAVNMGERLTHFVTDERGYRVNYSEKSRPLLDNPELSILMIGDSFLEALGVENEETIPERIRAMLETKYALRVRAVNAGVGAWQPGQYLLEAQRALKESRYDLGIVFFYTENDCVDKLQFEFSAQQVAPSTQLRMPGSFQWGDLKKDVFYPLNNYLEQRSHFFVFLKDRFQILLARVGLTPYYFPDIFYRKEAASQKWGVAATMAQLIEKEFRQFNVPVLFVLLPADYQIYPHLNAKYVKMFGLAPEEIDLAQPNRRLGEHFREKSLSVMDMLPVFRQKAAQGISLYGRIDNHMNAEGHAIVAEAIFPWVEQNLEPELFSRTHLYA